MNTPKIYLFILLLSFLNIIDASAQITQTIRGRVIDVASKAPITGAIIQIIDLPQNGGVTETDGTFALMKVPVGRHAIRVTYIGYEERVMNDVLVTAGKEVYIEVPLQEAIHKLKEVTVVYNKSRDKTRTNNDMAQVSARSFNVDETKRFAGSLGDPSRMAANFAGVVSGNDSRNDIVVRGNAPTGMLWQMEGLNIPNVNHYGSLGTTGGPVSMINNNNIDKSDFMTSAFPAQYGNALAGVFDIRLREGNKNKNEFLAQLGFNGLEAGAEGPIGKNKKSSYLVNYRYSTLGIFQAMGINFGAGAAVPLYQDLNYKFAIQINRKTKVIAFGIVGKSKIDFLGKDVDTSNVNMYDTGDPYADERNRFGSAVYGLAVEYRPTDKIYSKLTLGYSTTMQTYKADSLSTVDYRPIKDAEGDFGTRKASIVWNMLYKVDAKNNIQGGITYDHTFFHLVNKDYRPDGTAYVYADNEGNYGLAQGYMSWKHRYSNKLSSVVGVHGQAVTLNSGAAVEPRASVRYALSSRQAVSLGYGLHHQAQNLYTYFVETPVNGVATYTNKQLAFTRSNHYVLTYDNNLTEQLRLKAEVYYQSLANVPIERRVSAFSVLNTGADFGLSDVDSLVNGGTGYNYGTELTLERYFDKGFYFLVTGSLFNSRYKGSDGVDRNTAFNTGYVLNTLAGKEWRVGRKQNVLAVNLKVSAVGGRYETPVDLEASKEQGYTVWIDKDAFSQRKPAYFRSDVRISYRKEWAKSTLEMAIDFQNVSNQKNIYERYYDRSTGKIVTAYQQGFFPVPSLRFTF